MSDEAFPNTNRRSSSDAPLCGGESLRPTSPPYRGRSDEVLPPPPGAVQLLLWSEDCDSLVSDALPVRAEDLERLEWITVQRLEDAELLAMEFEVPA